MRVMDQVLAHFKLKCTFLALNCEDVWGKGQLHFSFHSIGLNVCNMWDNWPHDNWNFVKNSLIRTTETSPLTEQRLVKTVVDLIYKINLNSLTLRIINPPNVSTIFWKYKDVTYGARNLCLEMFDNMQKESTQCKHPKMLRLLSWKWHYYLINN